MDGSDARWLADARRGEALAFRRLVEAQARPLFALCMRITRDAGMAEDAVQEALYKAWRALPDFDGRSAFGTWLHRIAANAALEQLRRNARHLREDTDAGGDHDTTLLDTLDSGAPGPEDHATGGEIAARVDLQLARMSVLERTAFVLRHYQGESLEAIAAALDINIGQTKQAVFRAVRKLRLALEPWRDA
jgi:RNA polymerase sigma-70 factor (ECF subfamily)